MRPIPVEPWPLGHDLLIRRERLPLIRGLTHIEQAGVLQTHARHEGLSLLQNRSKETLDRSGQPVEFAKVHDQGPHWHARRVQCRPQAVRAACPLVRAIPPSCDPDCNKRGENDDEDVQHASDPRARCQDGRSIRSSTGRRGEAASSSTGSPNRSTICGNPLPARSRSFARNDATCTG